MKKESEKYNKFLRVIADLRPWGNSSMLFSMKDEHLWQRSRTK